MKELIFDDIPDDISVIELDTVQEDTDIRTYEPYMYTDSNFVGYPDLETQQAIYNAALFGNIIQPNTNILDVGSGRSDLLQYIHNNNIAYGSYTGIECRELLYDIATELNKSSPNIGVKDILMNEVFNSDTKFNTIFNWVFHLTDLTLDYGVSSYTDVYDNFRSILEKSLSICTEGVVFMLLNGTDAASESYISHNIGKIAEICNSMNLKYAIDHTDFSNIYKLLILKN